MLKLTAAVLIVPVLPTPTFAASGMVTRTVVASGHLVFLQSAECRLL